MFFRGHNRVYYKIISIRITVQLINEINVELSPDYECENNVLIS